MRFIAVESRDLGRSYGLGVLHARYRARRNHGTLFEPLVARQRIPGIATDVLVMRIGAAGHRAVEGRGGRHGVLDEAAVTLDRAAMGWSNRGFLSCDQRVLAN